MRPRGQLGLGASLCGARRLSGVRSSPPGRDRCGGAPLPERGPLGAAGRSGPGGQGRAVGERAVPRQALRAAEFFRLAD